MGCCLRRQKIQEFLKIKLFQENRLSSLSKAELELLAAKSGLEQTKQDRNLFRSDLESSSRNTSSLNDRYDQTYREQIRNKDDRIQVLEFRLEEVTLQVYSLREQNKALKKDTSFSQPNLHLAEMNFSTLSNSLDLIPGRLHARTGSFASSLPSEDDATTTNNNNQLNPHKSPYRESTVGGSPLLLKKLAGHNQTTPTAFNSYIRVSAESDRLRDQIKSSENKDLINKLVLINQRYSEVEASGSKLINMCKTQEEKNKTLLAQADKLLMQMAYYIDKFKPKKQNKKQVVYDKIEEVFNFLTTDDRELSRRISSIEEKNDQLNENVRTLIELQKDDDIIGPITSSPLKEKSSQPNLSTIDSFLSKDSMNERLNELQKINDEKEMVFEGLEQKSKDDRATILYLRKQLNFNEELIRYLIKDRDKWKKINASLYSENRRL